MKEDIVGEKKYERKSKNVIKKKEDQDRKTKIYKEKKNRHIRYAKVKSHAYPNEHYTESLSRFENYSSPNSNRP